MSAPRKLAPPAAPPDPRARGVLQRKHHPRTALAHWDPALRRRTPAELLQQATQDRIPALLPLKRQRMSVSPFAYFRGSLAVMAYDLSLLPHTGISTQLCGDAHVLNFGAFSAPDGTLIFDLNDFDETISGPFEWDVKRMTTSILLAGDSAHLRRRDSNTAAALFLEAYSAMLRRLAAMPVLAAARFQIHRRQGVDPVARILLEARRETPATTLQRLTRPSPRGRVFQSHPPLLNPLTGKEARQVLHSLRAYALTLAPERRHSFAHFRPLAVARKVVGTGSVGLRDYCVYLEGNGPADPLFLQLKQQPGSALAPYLRAAPAGQSQAQRVVQGQRTLQFQSDPLLGFTRISGRDFLVRQLSDHKGSIDIASIKPAGLAAYAEICGEILARAHARAGDPRVLSGYIGKGSRFRQSLLAFAHAYAAQTTTDFHAFTSASQPKRRAGHSRPASRAS